MCLKIFIVLQNFDTCVGSFGTILIGAIYFLDLAGLSSITVAYRVLLLNRQKRSKHCNEWPKLKQKPIGILLHLNLSLRFVHMRWIASQLVKGANPSDLKCNVTSASLNWPVPDSLLYQRIVQIIHLLNWPIWPHWMTNKGFRYKYFEMSVIS